VAGPEAAPAACGSNIIWLGQETDAGTAGTASLFQKVREA
jgi:hypothetical protein